MNQQFNCLKYKYEFEVRTLLRLKKYEFLFGANTV